MLSSGSRKAMKALLILLAAAWITTGGRSHPQHQKRAYSSS
jgi:hypothetical protein